MSLRQTALTAADSVAWVLIKDIERFVKLMKSKPQILSILLFFLTLTTTTMAGCWMKGASFGASPWVGLPFGLSFMAILLAHEMGHYLQCKKNNLACTPPYFIPFPIGGIGTLGAFIAIKERLPNRRVLFDVGAWGPIAGLILTIPILLIGIGTSTFVPVVPTEGVAAVSTGVEHWIKQPSVLTMAAIKLTHWNEIAALKDVPGAVGYTLNLNGMAVAGILGLLLTMLNLFPVGQLDGGHIAHALFGYKKANIIGLVTLICMAAAGVFFFPPFLTMLVFVLFLGGGKRQPLPQKARLDRKRLFAGFALLATFFLCLPLPL